jgi:hypothetical protein
MRIYETNWINNSAKSALIGVGLSSQSDEERRRRCLRLLLNYEESAVAQIFVFTAPCRIQPSCLRILRHLSRRRGVGTEHPSTSCASHPLARRGVSHALPSYRFRSTTQLGPSTTYRPRARDEMTVEASSTSKA